GVLAGLAGGVVIGALAMARRTATAPDRLRAAVHLDDARVLVFGSRDIGDRIAALPMVRSSWTADSMVGLVEGNDVSYAGITAGPPSPPDLFTPVVVEGRPAVAANEVMLAEEVASATHHDVGDVLTLRLLTPDQVAQFDTGFGEPAGPRAALRVTGIARLPSVGQGIGGVFASPAFDEKYRSFSVGPTVLLRLRPGSNAALTAAVDELSKEVVLPDEAEEFGPLQPVFPRRTEDPKVRTAQRVLVAGLAVFILVALLAGLLAIGQTLARHHAAGAAEQRIEATLGLTAWERVLARTLPATLGAGVAVLASAATALAAAGLQPMGGLTRFEPHPGWVPNVGVIAVGCVVTGFAFVVVAAVTTWRAPAGDAIAPRRSAMLPAAIAARLRRPWVLAGTTFAVNRGRGRTAVPVRTTTIGAILGIAGVVGAATFSAGLHRLGDSPARYGWNADFSVSDAKPADVPELAADPRVRALDWVRSSTVRLGDDFVPAYAQTSLKGDLGWTLHAGRLPRAADEIAVGPAVLRRHGMTVGGFLHVPDVGGRDHPLRVVGTVLTPVDGNQALGVSVLLTVSGLLAVQQSPPSTSALVKAAPGAARDLRNDLAPRFEIFSATQPSEVRNVTDLGRLPDALGVFLCLLGAAALAHGLVLTSSRRAHDIAVLRSLGFTPRQVAASVLTMAGVTATIGLVAGLPLGLAVGRLVWHQVAASTQVATDVALPDTLLAMVVPVVLCAAAVLALLPARRSAAVGPAGVLRTE
ncbi:MAG: putative transport system permease protein, partial [Actinomycetota bacterium]|nr:putative transport system permease protein [Actinomycetota bacterium]